MKAKKSEKSAGKAAFRDAVSLRRRAETDAEYCPEARRVKSEMLAMINAEARDAGLQKYQDIFRRHPDRAIRSAS